ncbi:MAG: hypothetical protein ACOC7J_01065 [Armatimonadota bacterium]
MKRMMLVIALPLSLTLVLAATGVAVAQRDNDRLREQMRDRERVIDADLRALRQQERDAEFGGRVYWELHRSIRALEREKSDLRSLDSALRMENERLIERRHSDYLRAHQDTMRQRRNLAQTQARDLSFGSREWHDQRRAADSWQRQQRAREPFGPEYRRSLEAHIRLLRTRRSQAEFGSQQWHAINRQLNALQRALRSAR